MYSTMICQHLSPNSTSFFSPNWIVIGHFSIILTHIIFKTIKIRLIQSFYILFHVYSISNPINCKYTSYIAYFPSIFQLNFHSLLVSSQSRISEFISNTKKLIIFQNIQLCNVYGIVIIFNIHLMLFETTIKYEFFIF